MGVRMLQSAEHRQPISGPNSSHRQRVHTVTVTETLRSIVERLAQPGAVHQPVFALRHVCYPV